MMLRGAVLPWARSTEGLLFFGLWILYGILINAYDLQSFNLQQMGIEAIVERGQVAVDGSPTPQLQPGGDVFAHDGHLFAAKQPGQFFAGALVYGVLHGFGLSYLRTFLLTAGLVTFLTASLATAVAAVCVYRLAREWSAPAMSPLWAWLAALAFGIASTALPYAGVEHHDALATAYLTVAFYLVSRSRRRLKNPMGGGVFQQPAGSGAVAATLTGLLLGWTVTTSMLPAAMVIVTGLAAIARQPRRAPWLAVGGVIGLAPLLAYNWMSFGHPLLMPNLAGQFADTFFFLDWRNFSSKVVFYAEMVTLYVPIFWCGVAGLACFPAALRRAQLAVAALLVGLFVSVCNIETLGGCQYGPRYLLPAMPFAALGLVGFSHLRRTAVRRVVALAVAVVAAGSAIINLVGALYGAMYCDLSRYAFTHYVAAIGRGAFRTYPLALWLVIPLGLWLMAVVATLDRTSDRRPTTDDRGPPP
jgi:hypothetical protein